MYLSFEEHYNENHREESHQFTPFKTKNVKLTNSEDITRGVGGGGT